MPTSDSKDILRIGTATTETRAVLMQAAVTSGISSFNISSKPAIANIPTITDAKVEFTNILSSFLLKNLATMICTSYKCSSVSSSFKFKFFAPVCF